VGCYLQWLWRVAFGIMKQDPITTNALSIYPSLTFSHWTKVQDNRVMSLWCVKRCLTIQIVINHQHSDKFIEIKEFKCWNFVLASVIQKMENRSLGSSASFYLVPNESLFPNIPQFPPFNITAILSFIYL